MEIEKTELDGTRIEIAGFRHSYPEEISFMESIYPEEDLEQTIENLETRMEDADNFAFEAAGYKQGFREDEYLYPESSGFTGKILESASEHFEKIWGARLQKQLTVRLCTCSRDDTGSGRPLLQEAEKLAIGGISRFLCE